MGRNKVHFSVHAPWLWIICLGAALSAAGLVNLAARSGAQAPLDRREQRNVGELEALFQATDAASQAEDLPTDMYKDVLGANEILYKRIRDRRGTFELYVSKWARGNPYAFEVAEHLPDLCWSLTGWRCEETRSDVVYKTGSAYLKPGEWRTFSFGTIGSQQALFWGVVGASLIKLEYRPEPVPEVKGVVEMMRDSDFIGFWFSRSRGSAAARPKPDRAIGEPIGEDVYFVRINSEIPLHEVVETEMFMSCHAMLRTIGVMADSSAP
jgi:hypothetical protein